MEPVDTFGDDLILLAIDPKGGRVRQSFFVRYGLMGSELIRLIAADLVRLDNGRLTVAGYARGSTGDAELDAALSSIASASRPPWPKDWLRKSERKIVRSYLANLASAEKIRLAEGSRADGSRADGSRADSSRADSSRADGSRATGFRARWRVTDQAGLAAALMRLDLIATGTGPVDPVRAAFCALVSASMLVPLLYPGPGDKRSRERLREVGNDKWTLLSLEGKEEQKQAAIEIVARATATTAAGVKARFDAAAAGYYILP